MQLSDVCQAPFFSKVLSSRLHSLDNLADLFFPFFDPKGFVYYVALPFDLMS